jgi:hypothetical protein
MKSFAQLAKAAYNAWHQSHGTDKHQVPFEQLDAEYRAHWVGVAKAVAEEVSTVH